MPRTIHKYQLEITDATAALMPKRAEILCVQMQRGVPCVWAMVDTRYPKVSRVFAWRGTGHNCDDLIGEKYVGTVQTPDGSLVFHLFDLGES